MDKDEQRQEDYTEWRGAWRPDPTLQDAFRQGWDARHKRGEAYVEKGGLFWQDAYAVGVASRPTDEDIEVIKRKAYDKGKRSAWAEAWGGGYATCETTMKRDISSLRADVAELRKGMDGLKPPKQGKCKHEGTVYGKYCPVAYICPSSCINYKGI